MTKVVNLKREDYDVYIGRGKCPKTGKYSKWGNPFIMRNNSDEERDYVCTAYEDYFYKMGLDEDIGELKDKVLGCYCKPKRCHGDFLARLANEM